MNPEAEIASNADTAATLTMFFNTLFRMKLVGLSVGAGVRLSGRLKPNHAKLFTQLAPQITLLLC